MLALDESTSKDDIVIQLKGIRFAYSKHVEPYMEEVTIDCVPSPNGRKLILRSPLSRNC